MKLHDNGYEGHPPDLTVDELIILLFFRNGISVAAVARVFGIERRHIESTLREHYASLRRAYNAEIAEPPPQPSPESLEPCAFEVDF